MAFIETVADALRILIPETKSLRDSSLGAGSLSPMGQLSVIHTGDNSQPAFKKQNVQRWRIWSQYSWAVRRAIDIHRNFAMVVAPDVTPIDDKSPVDKVIKKELEDLLSLRMNSGDIYSEVKEKMVEDYFVVSHGVAELWLKKNGRPYNITAIDGAKIAFITNWDGSQDMPRYAEVDLSGKVIRYLGDQHVMAMINRKTSYDALGTSHVELLEIAVQGILAGDEHLLHELRYPTSSGALSLGEGVGPDKADEVRSKLMATAKHALIVLTGVKKPEFINFKDPKDLKRLDKQLWFIREVAATFGLPISVFAQSADQNRSNTIALLDQMGEGLKDTVTRIKYAENYDIVRKYGSPAKHNLQIDYPVLSQKDALKQAQLTAVQLADQPYSSINEGRKANGLERIELPIADEVLINTSKGIVPLTALNRQLFGNDNTLDDPIATDQGQVADGNQPAKFLPGPGKTRKMLSALEHLSALTK